MSVTRRLARIAALAAAALVLPVSPAWGVAADGPADPSAVWTVLRSLPAADVDVVFAGLDPAVQDDLQQMVRASAGSPS